MTIARQTVLELKHILLNCSNEYADLFQNAPEIILQQNYSLSFDPFSNKPHISLLLSIYRSYSSSSFCRARNTCHIQEYI